MKHRMAKWVTERWGENWQYRQEVRFLAYGGFAVLLFFLLLGQLVPQTYEIQIGRLSQETLRSPVQMIDPKATEEARQKAENNVPPQYVRDAAVMESQVKRLDQEFDRIAAVTQDDQLSTQQKAEQLAEVLTLARLDEKDFRQLAKLTPERLNALRSIARSTVIFVLNAGVQEGNAYLQESRAKIQEQVKAFDLTEWEAHLVVELASASIRPNILYDPEATRRLKEEARNQVEPVMIEKGEPLVQAGQLITREVYERLEMVGLVRDPGQSTVYHLAAAGFLVLLLLALAAFLKQYPSPIQKGNKPLLLYLSILLLNAVVLKIFAAFQVLGYPYIGFGAPATLGVMLILLLLGRGLAVFAAIVTAILASVFLNTDSGEVFDFRYGFVTFVSSIASLYVLSQVSQRSAIFKAGLYASTASLLSITAVLFLQPGTSLREWVYAAAFGLAAGLLASILTIGLMPLFEAVFGYLSAVKLIELSNPNQPLLKRLLIEAPGTYHHSMMVANLSEAAAEAIGANGLLAKVGSYYHDVGKMKRPAFFVENQLNQENPHDKISPYLSKTIILAHPYDGVKMLKEAGIPKVIQDFAEQHHGTTLLKYFYHKAKQMADGSEVLEEDYRYPGPKAQTRETAIVGICDSVEAAVRSMTKLDPGRIEQLVRKIIKERLDDGQFDECDLTLKDLERVAEAICERLNGVFHPRIEYPEMQKERKKA
ncbi:MAG: hypothetical protein BAA01_12770 [Bacillus thermozeamaize]|jgi:hypothetical protein|uniref:HD/PDEase domain-containing protein n=1 Tax=Bacillus thermozeamaize TaxID=230954 RepID=A0A1Y3PT26_9BACI|nr:MAG: hypothetical protein BAA01_12770 [Bacillus thermozeamaize]